VCLRNLQHKWRQSYSQIFQRNARIQTLFPDVVAAMTDLLAKPIWHSLSTSHSDLAEGNHLAKWMFAIIVCSTTADTVFVVVRFGNPNVGTFVSHEREHVCKSLNALSVLNGGFDDLCAGRWLISYLFVTTNSQIASRLCGN